VRQAQDKAVRFAQNVLVDEDLADELDGLSPEEYADRKGLVIQNPQKLKGAFMPRKSNADRIADLEDKLDLIAGIITGDVGEDSDDDVDDVGESDDDDDDDV
jgi:hypothetical protein